MRIGVCDDQKIYRDEIISACSDLLGDIAVEYKCFSSGEELLDADSVLDFLFLDIEMENIDGIQVKDALEIKSAQTKIIFLTSHEERMIEAFGINVMGFLKKPLCEEALVQIVKRMTEFASRRIEILEVSGTQHLVLEESIRYITAQDKYTLVVTHDAEYLVRRTMKEWEEMLSGEVFCRVNRFYLVNLDLFDKKKCEVILEDGKSIRLSRKNKTYVEEQYRRYLRKRMEEL